MPTPFAPAGDHAPTSRRSLRPASSTRGWSSTSTWPGKRLAGVATLTLAARRDAACRRSSSTPSRWRSTRSPSTAAGRPASTTTVSACASRAPQPLARDAELRADIRYRCAPRRGLYFMGPDERPPRRPLQCWTQGQDDDSRYCCPCLDHADREVDDRGRSARRRRGSSCSRTATCASGVELPRAASARALALRARLPAPAYLVTLVCGPFVEITRPRARRRASTSTTSRARARGRRAPQLRAHARDDRPLLASSIGVPYPYARYSQVVVPDFIFGGMENTTRDDADRHGAARRARRARPRRRRARRARARAPVVRRSRDLPRLVRGLAQRGLRDLLRVRLARARQGPRRGRLSSCSPTPRATWARRGRYQRPIVCQHYDEPIDIFDAHLYEKGGRVLHMLRTSSATSCSGARSRHYAEHARARARSRRATSRAPSRRSRAAASTSSSTAGSRAPATPSWRARWEWDEERKRRHAARSRRSRRSAPRRRCSSSRRACASRSTARSATSR